jgi:uncharacterized surface protein with fasciclin (FAS1) repeats
MNKTLTALTALSAVALAGTAAANCSFHQAHDTGMKNYTGGFVKTGGYATAESSPDIVDTAVSAGSFNTLVEAVQAAGLVETLKGDGPYTVFAPTDEAFARLPAGTLESLLADKEKLAQVLKYHVVPGKLDAKAVTGMSRLATVSGTELPVDSIRIAKTDIMTSNGIIHIIDEVLIPNS